MKIIVLLSALAMATGAWGKGLLCTLPSGITVHLATGSCPSDTVRSRPDDGTVFLPNGDSAVPPPQPSRGAPSFITVRPTNAQPAPITAPRQSAKPAGKDRNIVDESYAICSRLKSAGATTCNVNINIFSASYLDATIPTSPRDAQMTCLAVANETRQPGSPFIGRGWELRIFSPLGSGDRPIAVCRL